METKKKILLVVGAGGSVEVGYPLINGLNEEIEFQLKNFNKNLFDLYLVIKNILNNKSDKKLKRLDKVIKELKEKSKKNLEKELEKLKNPILLEEIKDNKKFYNRIEKLKYRNNIYLIDKLKELKNLILRNDDLVKELEKIQRVLTNEDFSFEQSISFLRNYLFQKQEHKLGLYIEEIKDFTNFEEIAFVCLKLSSYLRNNNDTPLVDEIFSIKNSDKLRGYSSDDFQELYKKIAEIVTRRLSSIIATDVLNVEQEEKQRKTNRQNIEKFYKSLCENFEIGIITTNYDPLLNEIFSDFFVGFNKEDGEFLKKEILFRKKWEFLYHVHGSIHNRIINDKIIWDKSIPNDLSKPINENVSYLKEKRDAGEYVIRQSIVIGYDKQQQIMYDPFKTFFSKLVSIVSEAEGVIFIGCGFNDIHLNATFEDFRDKEKKKVIVIDWFENWKDENGTIQTDKLEHDLERYKKFHSCFGLKYMSTKSQEGEVEYHTKNENPENINYETIIYKLGLVAATKHIDEIIKFLNDRN